MPDFTAGSVEWDPEAIARTKRAYRAPLEGAAALSPMGLGAGMAARAGILAPGAREVAKQRAIANALRSVRKPNKPEEIAERMFMP